MAKLSWCGAIAVCGLYGGALIVVASCSTLIPPPAPAPAPIVATVAECPTLHEFSPAQNTELSAAIEALPADSIWLVVAADDQKMRAQARACIANKAK